MSFFSNDVIVASTLNVSNDPLDDVDGFVLQNDMGQLKWVLAAILNSSAETSSVLDIAGNSLTSGSALNITSSSTGKSGGPLVNIQQTGVLTGQDWETLSVSTSATTGGMSGVASFSGNSLTEGTAVLIMANSLITGSALNVTSSSTAKTTGALVNIEQTMNDTSQSSPTLTVSTSATSSGSVASFTGDSLTTSNAVSISADSLTTGIALDITSSSTSKTTGGLVNIAQTGDFLTSQSAPTLTVSTSATDDSGAGVASFTGDGMTTGKAVSISADSLTTGIALDITSSSAVKTTGGLVNIAQSGVSTLQTSPTLTVSTSASTQGSVASFTGNSLTTSNAVSISATGLTTGSALKITANATNAKALEIVNGFMVMKSETITIADADTTGIADLNLFISSVIFIDMNDTTVADTFLRTVKDGLATTVYADGQIAHIFFDNTITGTAGASLKLDFGLDGLCTGSGVARYLTFSTTGQSASLIYVNSKWWIINTGATVSTA